MQNTSPMIAALYSVSLASYIHSLRGEMETINDKQDRPTHLVYPGEAINNITKAALRAEFRSSTDITHFHFETGDGITFHFTASMVSANHINAYKIVGSVKVITSTYMVDGVAASPIWRVQNELEIMWAADER